MERIVHYQIRCTTENKDKDWYLPKGGPAPTKCPTTSSHTTNAAVVIKELTGQTDAELDADRAAKAADKAADQAALAASRDETRQARGERDAEKLVKEQIQAEIAIVRNDFLAAKADLQSAKREIDNLKPKRPEDFKLLRWGKRR